MNDSFHKLVMYILGLTLLVTTLSACSSSTQSNADLPEFTGGAKTGTAQLGNVNTALGKTYNGVFVAFAPYDNPQIAFAGVVEFGDSGGSTAGYVAKAAFMKYFGWKSTNGN